MCPVEVYDNLIATAHEYIGPLERYMELRKKIMGVDELHLYDTSVPRPNPIRNTVMKKQKT
ncbi:MAG: hypothetical protein U5N26_04220 [Candidatus Marinimicrobia bacterium]|nr:hypothetical protein [Candidatus Neomarinimicrobiota bacterium]